MNNTIITIILIVSVLLAGCSTQNEIQQSAINNENIEKFVPEPKDAVDAGLATEEEIKTIPSENIKFEESGMSFEIDGESYVYEKAPLLPQTPVADFMTITAPDSIGVQLRMLPNEIGEYRAGEGPSSYRLVDVWFTFNGIRYIADKDKGSATIKLEKIGVMNGFNYEGEVEGTFEGTFISDSGESIKVENGFFISKFIK